MDKIVIHIISLQYNHAQSSQQNDNILEIFFGKISISFLLRKR